MTKHKHRNFIFLYLIARYEVKNQLQTVHMHLAGFKGGGKLCCKTHETAALPTVHMIIIQGFAAEYVIESIA